MSLNFADFIKQHLRVVEPLEINRNLAYWKAAGSGKKEDYDELARLQVELNRIYTSKEDFDFVSKARESGRFDGPLEERTAYLVYLRYLGNQVDEGLLERITKSSSAVENRFNTYRPELDGERLTENDVREILRDEEDSEKRRKVWESSKRVGELISEELIELVGLRNRAAEESGFENFYSMSLYLTEQDEAELLDLFDRLDDLTRGPFTEYKKKLDAALSRRFGIPVKALMPWHYTDPFFQEPPPPEGTDPDSLFEERNPVRIAAKFYDSVGMEVSDILERSDLYERDGKSPHAFCIDIDRRGDIRVLCNIKNNSKWMGTILHELGHGVYDKNIDPGLPYFLRRYPHYCLTEAAAMFFGALSKDAGWLRKALVLDEGEYSGISGVYSEYRRAELLVFARWCQVMFRFERELYRRPRGDLDSLWWGLVEKYQLISPPPGRGKADWASKIHLVTSPVYYHNYMLGELIAAQFLNRTREIAGDGDGYGFEDIYGNREVGEYFVREVFGPGNVLPWNERVERATGESLRPDYFADYFSQG